MFYLLVESLFEPPARTESPPRLFFGAGGSTFCEKVRGKKEKGEKKRAKGTRRRSCSKRRDYIILSCSYLVVTCERLLFFRENFHSKGAVGESIFNG